MSRPRPPPPPAFKQPDRRRFRDWAATGVMGLALIATHHPGLRSVGQRRPGADPLKPWVAGYSDAAYQESRARIHYKGTWTVVRHPSLCRGPRPRCQATAGASARITFDGTGIAWVGPVGPTRGKAKVYIDGKLVKAVDTHATHYEPTKVLFKTTFAKLGHHTLTHRRSTARRTTRPSPSTSSSSGAPRDQRSPPRHSPGAAEGPPRQAEPDPGAASTPTAAPSAAADARPDGCADCTALPPRRRPPHPGYRDPAPHHRPPPRPPRPRRPPRPGRADRRRRRRPRITNIAPPT